MMSLVMSGGGAGNSGGKGGGGASGRGDVDISGDGVVVGAEGTYPVEIGFTSERGGAGSETETGEGETAGKVAQKANRGGAGEASGLGTWAADFGLFLSDDREDTEGAGGFEPNSPAGRGAVEARVLMDTKEGGGVNRVGQASDEAGTSGAEAVEIATSGIREVATEGPVDGRPLSATEAAGVNGGTGSGAAGTRVTPRVPGTSKREPSGFFEGLRDMSGNRGDEEVANLEEAARVAGGELYSLDDRLSALSVLLGQRPLAASGKGAASVSAAAGEVTWLRSVLKTGEYSDLFRKAGEVRRAAKAVERSVRSAERALKQDIALLDDAGGISGWCRNRDPFPDQKPFEAKQSQLPCVVGFLPCFVHAFVHLSC